MLIHDHDYDYHHDDHQEILTLDHRMKLIWAAHALRISGNFELGWPNIQKHKQKLQFWNAFGQKKICSTSDSDSDSETIAPRDPQQWVWKIIEMVMMMMMMMMMIPNSEFERSFIIGVFMTSWFDDNILLLEFVIFLHCDVLTMCYHVLWC